MSDAPRGGTDATGFATAGDGTRLAFRLRGNRGSRKVALIHSLAMTGGFWDGVADCLVADGVQVLTWDCRGHGASDKPAGPYTVQQFADDLAAVFATVGWDRGVVAGASMGGCVALAFAEAYPQRVSGLGLIDTTACYGPQAPQQWAERAEKGVSEGLASLVDFQKTRWFGDEFRERNPKVVAESVAVFVANAPEAYADTCRMLGAADLRAGLSRIAVPTTVIVGEEDYATPVAMARALHQAIAGSTLTVIEGGRHLTPLEVPDQIAAELLKLPASAGEERAP